MGRFKVVQNADLAPGVDYVTSSSVGPFIDTGRDIKFGERNLGRLYLSKDTVAEMARELGVASNIQATEEALANAYISGKLDGLKETFGGDIVRVVDVLERWLAHLRSGGPGVAPGSTAEAG